MLAFRCSESKIKISIIKSTLLKFVLPRNKFTHIWEANMYHR